MPERRRICIVGTDTDAGKTVVAAALAKAAQQAGLAPLVLKPVQTGCAPGYAPDYAPDRAPDRAPDHAPDYAPDHAPDHAPGRAPDYAPGGYAAGYAPDASGRLLAPDCAVYGEACPEAEIAAALLLREACSPHLAARREGLALSAAALSQAIEARLGASSADPAFIEGAGGLLTPLNESESLLDALAPLSASFILVAANKLGMLNHALLSVELLRARGLPLLGCILTEPEPASDSELERRIRADNRAILPRIAKLPLLGEIPHIPELRHPDPAVRARGWSEAALSVAEALTIVRGGECSPVRSGVCSPSSRGLGSPDRAASDRAASDRAGSERAGSERAGSDCAGSDRAGSDRAASDRAGSDRAASDRAASDRAASDRAASDRAASDDLPRFDREHVWHPYAPALGAVRAREAVETAGARIVLRGGESLVDGMASWWCAVHGYRHPALMRALRRQAGRMPHVMFGGLTHEPAVELARKLLDITPPGLDRVFFADSGSVAVEVAIKMAVQYQRAMGRPERSRLLTVRGGYHGDTLGAMSVCDPENGMHTDFNGILPQQLFAPRPVCRFGAAYDPGPAEAFAECLERHAGEVAAVILEPVLQGAGGMWMYHPEFLRRVGELCEKRGCLLILDEIATGFGRTGRLFACEWAGVRPDILCLGKALTGGVMSLAATLATREVAEGISRRGGVLMHGPTFMGNPLACAVAGASVDLLAEGGWKADVARIERAFRQGLEPCRNAPGIADVRVLGAVGVLETARPVKVEKLQEYFVRRGVWLRPFGRLIYAMPPYVIDDEDLDRLVRAMRGAAGEGQWE